ncbi:MAG: M20/M25/M40 family metallo-hydrolase, partial [Planctomycetes bacterium]|nr:M20/M25/M40 family metallo-hydrolase [Planctomycetota bacterium]
MLTSELRRAGLRAVPAARPPLPIGRENVLAFRLGVRPEAVLFTGHLDTVPCDSRQRVGAARRGSRPIVEGRGILDMKSGIAAGVVAAAELSRRGFGGAIIHLAVADEEGDSLGMRASLLPLKALLNRYGLRIVAAVNLDFVEMGTSWTAYTGSVGKLLVGIVLAGETRHASGALASHGVADDLARLIHHLPRDPRLHAGERQSLPRPVLLHAETVREAYGISVPGIARLEIHVPFFRRSPAEVVRAVADATSSILGARRRVTTVCDLPPSALAVDSGRSIGDVRIAAFRATLSRLRNARARHRPRACVFLAPPVYPPVETEADAPVVRALRSMARDDHGHPRLRLSRCYPFVSDLSYLRAPRRTGTSREPTNFVDEIASLLPFPAAVVRAIDLATTLDLPVVNV